MGLLQLNFTSPSLALFPEPHPSLTKSGHKKQIFGFPRKAKIAPSRISCSAKLDNSSVVVKKKSVSVVLLAGGKGKRMGANMPKQYLPLLGQPIALYRPANYIRFMVQEVKSRICCSFDAETNTCFIFLFLSSFYTFSHMPEVKEIVVVCDPSYQDIFEDSKENISVDLKFSLPGKERQDSVYSGFQAIDSNSELVCIHDSARPLVTSGDVEKVLKDGWLIGAAALGVPSKATIKEANSESFVVRTLDRKTLWEMQTPQVIKPELLKKGFELVNSEGLEVTDDVSIVEHLKHPVYITEGSYTNIKEGGALFYILVTTPDDLLLAERIFNMRLEPANKV
ncbi:hypothetical protein Pint_33010 [Pistacia integerrima]|uniref:Uncharacterized protein n=1 Tax=Pistacia integerrima TaxID=434235 RepID=A0ACC0X6B6_9ROSI|nr:hypothetical protein Pint_33010 [Pistacia integerrima]